MIVFYNLNKLVKVQILACNCHLFSGMKGLSWSSSYVTLFWFSCEVDMKTGNINPITDALEVAGYNFVVGMRTRIAYSCQYVFYFFNITDL